MSEIFLIHWMRWWTKICFGEVWEARMTKVWFIDLIFGSSGGRGLKLHNGKRRKDNISTKSNRVKFCKFPRFLQTKMFLLWKFFPIGENQ